MQRSGATVGPRHSAYRRIRHTSPQRTTWDAILAASHTTIDKHQQMQTPNNATLISHGSHDSHGRRGEEQITPKREVCLPRGEEGNHQP